MRFTSWLEAWCDGYNASQEGQPNDETLLAKAAEGYEQSGGEQARRVMEAFGFQRTDDSSVTYTAEELVGLADWLTRRVVLRALADARSVHNPSDPEVAEYWSNEILLRLKALSGCEHDWVDVSNADRGGSVESGEMCKHCRAIRAA